MKWLFTILVCLPTYSIFAQSTLDISRKEARKMNYVIAETKESKFPKALLYQIDRTHMTVLRDVSGNKLTKPIYAQKKLTLEDLGVVTVYSKKRRNIYKAVLGIGLGAGAYFLTDALTEKDLDLRALEALGQEPTTGFFEPIMAASIGLGVGLILGDFLYPKRVTMKPRRSAAMRELRKFAPPRKTKKR